MTTAVFEPASAGGGVRRPGLLPSARWLLNRQLEIVRWFLGLVVLVFGLAYPLIGRSGGDLPFSIWESFAANGPGWFVLAMGATAVTAYLPMLVASGATRSRFTLAAALAIATCAFILAVLVAAGFVYETYMFESRGWSHALNGAHVFASTTQAHLVVAEYTVRYLLFGLAGLLAGFGFYRAGGWWGTGLLLFTVVLPLGVGNALLNVRIGEPQTWADLGVGTATGLGVGSASAVGLGLALAFAVVLVVVARALMSTMPIRAKAA